MSEARQAKMRNGISKCPLVGELFVVGMTISLASIDPGAC